MLKTGAGVIIPNDVDMILLILRDNIPHIPYPNKWDITGRQVEKDEEPLQTVLREIREEIGIENVNEIHFYKSYFHDGIFDYIFWTKTNIELSSI